MSILPDALLLCEIPMPVKMNPRRNDKERGLSPLEPLLTIKDVADICVVNTKTVRRWIQSRQLVAIRLGRQWRIARKDLERFISDNRS